MSLRGLYGHLYQESQNYMVRDGRHVFIRWRRVDQVHALAKRYLETKIPGIDNVHVRATLACRDLMDLKLPLCVENNETKK